MYLKEKIINEITIKDNHIVLLDHLINHQVNVSLLNEIANELIEYFSNKKIDKILTIETGGIAISLMMAQKLGVNFVYAKKGMAANMQNTCYVKEVYSYTKSVTNTIYVNKDYLNKGENILIIDDFLATGNAISSLIEICNDAECNVVGAGFIVNKKFQNRISNLTIYSILEIEEIRNNKLILG